MTTTEPAASCSTVASITVSFRRTYGHGGR